MSDRPKIICIDCKFCPPDVTPETGHTVICQNPKNGWPSGIDIVTGEPIPNPPVTCVRLRHAFSEPGYEYCGREAIWFEPRDWSTELSRHSALHKALHEGIKSDDV